MSALMQSRQVLSPWLAHAKNLLSLDISRNPDLGNAGFYVICDALLPCSNVLAAFNAGACGLDSELDASVLRSFAKLRRFKMLCLWFGFHQY
jgi:hypothetical protein